jgi:uncharacterized membrane protein
VEIIVSVVPSRYDIPGTMDVVTLSLASKNISENTAEGSVLLLAAHHREIDLSLSQQAFVNYSVPEDRQIVYSMSVANLGNSAETVKLTMAGLDSFWAYLNTSYVFLDPGENGSVVLTMSPSLYVLAGAYEFNVSASSEADPTVNDTLSMGVNIQPFYDIETYLDTDIISPNGSEYLSVLLTVENWGNCIDLLDVIVYSDFLNDTVLVVNGVDYNISMESVPPIVLEPGNRVVITMLVAVPEGARAGNSYLLYIDVSSLTDPSIMSSEVLTLLIPSKGSLFNIYTVIAIAAIVSAVAIIAVFLFMRRRQRRREEEEAARRKKMQRRPGARPSARPATKSGKPGQGGQERQT